MSRRRILLGAAAAVGAALVLAACAPEPGTQTPSPQPGSSTTSTPTPFGSPVPTPTTDDGATAHGGIPDDCRAILSPGVLAQLEGVPLNDTGMNPSGPQPDGTLVCVWGEAGDETMRLTTTISGLSRGPALDLLNELFDEGFTCYQPDEGTRCETASGSGAAIEGRTLYYLDDVLIDTTFVGIAPSGYTDAIIAAIHG
ncbi:hypothetical protein GCM10022200_15870 [Microbacterium awajiense]|uniref:DUF3558 domain-containing protein n=1 Tax=Microbacterium awajiense TaxID=415214 RepID=A0ABP7AIQ9_9MICO